MEERANCASLHDSRPFAAEGDATVPSGSVTDASFKSGVARSFALSLCCTCPFTV